MSTLYEGLVTLVFNDICKFPHWDDKTLHAVLDNEGVFVPHMRQHIIDDARERVKKTGKKTIKQFCADYKAEHGCNCDLDRWEPDWLTGHSFVCRVHKAYMTAAKDDKILF